MTKRVGNLVALAAAVFISVAWAASPVAMVTDLEGSVTHASTGKAVELLGELSNGDTLSIPEGAALRLVYLASGYEYRVTGPDELHIEDDGVTSSSGSAVEGKALLADASSKAIAPVGELQQAALVMRSAGEAQKVRLRGPLGGRVLVAPPTLEWEALEDVEDYRLRITDYRGRSLLEERVQGTDFTLPDNLRLVPGATYTWSVEARLPDGGRESGFAEFAISDSQLRQEAINLRPEADAPFSERLVYTLWLESNELFQEADRYWEQLAEERPDSPRLQMLAGRDTP